MLGVDQTTIARWEKSLKKKIEENQKDDYEKLKKTLTTEFIKNQIF
jgi:hypothetical protein